MDPIEPSLAVTPPTAPAAAPGAAPESPAADSGGAAPFTQFLEDAQTAAAPAAAAGGAPTDPNAALAALFGPIPAAAGKELPPLAADDRPPVIGKDETDKPLAVPPAAPAPAMAALLTPAATVSPAMASATTDDVPVGADKAVAADAALASNARRPMPSPLPPAAATAAQEGKGSDTPAADGAAPSFVSAIDAAIERQAASPAAEPAALERAAPPARAEAPAPATVAVDTVRQLAAAVPAEAARASAAAPIPVPPDHPQWGQAFGERVVWLVNQHNASAQLSLNPPDLGRLDVRISLDQDQARVLFATPHESVREAIEAAVPRLREMLADTGVQLLDVGIERHAGGRQPHAFQAAPPAPARGDRAAEAASAESRPTPPSGGVGLVDYFV
jgi:flagellar hook-length control protein FliK